jgi:hypothetical protein
MDRTIAAWENEVEHRVGGAQTSAKVCPPPYVSGRPPVCDYDHRGSHDCLEAVNKSSDRTGPSLQPMEGSSL